MSTKYVDGRGNESVAVKQMLRGEYCDVCDEPLEDPQGFSRKCKQHQREADSECATRNIAARARIQEKKTRKEKENNRRLYR